VIVTDGERALQQRVAASFEDVTLVLDFLHALEKLWACGHALYREGSLEAQAFVYERAKRILEGRVDQVVKGLRLIVTKRKLTGTKAKTLLNTASYYQRNRQRMRYDLYLANGWPIASGSVERRYDTLPISMASRRRSGWCDRAMCWMVARLS